jgi:hypothetical protein
LTGGIGVIFGDDFPETNAAIHWNCQTSSSKTNWRMTLKGCSVVVLKLSYGGEEIEECTAQMIGDIDDMDDMRILGYEDTKILRYEDTRI